VATTLALGEQNHAAELKRVCLEFVSRNLGTVMQSEGYQHMIRSCPQLQVRRFAVSGRAAWQSRASQGYCTPPCCACSCVGHCLQWSSC